MRNQGRSPYGERTTPAERNASNLLPIFYKKINKISTKNQQNINKK